MKSQKQRLDLLLVERGLAPTRERARALIMAGAVTVDGQRQDKAGTLVRGEASVQLQGPPVPYVSRGGLKLERALQVFGLSPRGKTCLDVGASTGGFTDCLLQHGAACVYAIDVGYGQLDTRLREDVRVFSRERVNARYLSDIEVPEVVSFAVIDVSFISIRKVLPAVVSRLDVAADVVSLIKPQFEAGRLDVGKGGVVRSATVHTRVLREAVAAMCDAFLTPRGLIPSPILGPKGNVEFLLWSTRGYTADAPSGAVNMAARPDAKAEAELETEAKLKAVEMDALIESAVLEAHSRRKG